MELGLMNVTKMHLNKPQMMFSAPAQIVGTVSMVVTALISLILQRADVFGGMGGYLGVMQQNNALVFALPGFLIYYGVQAIATTYPFALALGATSPLICVGNGARERHSVCLCRAPAARAARA